MLERLIYVLAGIGGVLVVFGILYPIVAILWFKIIRRDKRSIPDILDDL